jgi:hypothetical protein
MGFIKRVRRLRFLSQFVELGTGNLLVTRHIFRDSRFTRVTFIRRDLAEAISAKGFTGLRWIEIEDYPQPRLERP